MYRHQCYEELKLELPFGVQLNQENRWVKLAGMFPWQDIEELYQKNFTGCDGQIAKPSRLAFGALYIQAEEGFTDEQTRRNIQENPYLQYFCGFECYMMETPFDASLMTYFRKRITSEMLQEITAKCFRDDASRQDDNPMEEEPDAEDECQDATQVSRPTMPENKGTLILDGTCCPADIHYPTDIDLLNRARELTQQMIDILYKADKTLFDNKPRDYREVARKEHLAYTKKRKHTAKETRTCVHRSLLFLKRDLGFLSMMVEKGASLSCLPVQLYRKLFVIQEIHRQQWEMYINKTNRVDDRIVSISQPHVRPIVRGKAGGSTEFGAKIVVGLVGGYAFIMQEGWDNYSEAKCLIEAADQYKQIFGFYPKTILGDRAYPINENRNWCKAHGVRLSGPRRGRKPLEEKFSESKQIYQDGCDRIPIEGTFGVCKRRYDLDRLMTKLPDTSLTSISMGFFAANMERKLRLLFAPEFDWALDYDFDFNTLVVYPRQLLN